MPEQRDYGDLLEQPAAPCPDCGRSICTAAAGACRPPLDPRNTWRVIDAQGVSREVASEDNARNKAAAFDEVCPARECPHRVQHWNGSEWVDA